MVYPGPHLSAAFLKNTGDRAKRLFYLFRVMPEKNPECFVQDERLKCIGRGTVLNSILGGLVAAAG